MKRTVICLSFILCAAIVICFSIFFFSRTGKSVTLKMSFDDCSLYNNVECYTPRATFIINGEPIYAMIDTGSSSGFHLHEYQLKKMKDLKKGRPYRTVDGAGKIHEGIEYVLDSVDVNGIKLKNITVTPFKPWGLNVFGGVELPNISVAGLGVFKDKQIMIDYLSNTLTILDNINHQLAITKNFEEFFFQKSADGLSFDVEHSGYKYRMILDTGSTSSIIWKERLKSYEPANCLIVDPKMDNKGCEATMLTIKSKNGNSKYFGAVIVPGNFKHMGNIDGVIGNNFLRDKKIFIDFKKNNVFIYDNLSK